MAAFERRRRRIRSSTATPADAAIPDGAAAPADAALPDGAATTLDDPADAGTVTATTALVADPEPEPAAADPADPDDPRPVPVPAPPHAAPAPARPAGATRPTSGPPGPQRSGRPPAAARPVSGGGALPATGDDRESERGLRGLVGPGSSQVSVGAALRARDAARPTDADLAEAEEHLVIVRRNWQPREDLPRR